MNFETLNKITELANKKLELEGLMATLPESILKNVEKNIKKEIKEIEKQAEKLIKKNAQRDV